VQADPKHWAEKACLFVIVSTSYLPVGIPRGQAVVGLTSHESRIRKLSAQPMTTFIFGKKSRQARTDINEHSHAYAHV